MAISKEDMEKTRQALLEHRRKMETDPTYRAETEELYKYLKEHLVTFGKDTDD